MRTGLVLLVLGYVLSQFYRAFLAVLSPVLKADLGATSADLALSSGLWFLAFALMQIPVGEALDRLGPRRTVASLLGLGGAGGAAVFALAEGPGAVHAAMLMIGIGCSPVLMSAYYIFARVYRPALFGALAGATIGIGSLGNIAGAAPLAATAAALGWRATLWGLAGVTLAVAVALAVFVRDPARAETAAGQRGTLLDLLRIPGFWAILPLMAVAYAPSAAIRGLWAGPYLATVYDADIARIGQGTLVMGLAMVAGNFAYGPADRLFGSWKRAVIAGNLAVALCLGALVLAPAPGYWGSVALLAGIGFFGATFPAMMAHGRAFFPSHLTGRGVTFLNMFGIGGAGLMQFLSGRVERAAEAASGSGASAFSVLFLFFLVPLAAGLALYLFSHDGPRDADRSSP